MTEQDKKIIDEMSEYVRQVHEEDDKAEMEFLKQLQAKLESEDDG